ncbi:hypothetical protein N431DRAFT_149112 [Stipitochalara longipes BDJ]|nr:hypothetical protein N431DRAFT_149112 [Stipitochalara longipes BDJ]
MSCGSLLQFAQPCRQNSRGDDVSGNKRTAPLGPAGMTTVIIFAWNSDTCYLLSSYTSTGLNHSSHDLMIMWCSSSGRKSGELRSTLDWVSSSISARLCRGSWYPSLYTSRSCLQRETTAGGHPRPITVLDFACCKSHLSPLKSRSCYTVISTKASQSRRVQVT